MLAKLRLLRLDWPLVVALLLTNIFASLIATYANIPPSGSLVQENGQLFGGDFLPFYNAGLIAKTDLEHLYSLDFQQSNLDRFLGSEKEHLTNVLPFAYPPLIGGLLSIYSKLPYKQSYLAWTISALIASFLSLIYLTYDRSSFSLRHLPIILLFIAGFVPLLFNTIVCGQMPWIGIALLSGTAILLKRDLLFIAGVFFALSFYKPPLFLFALLVLLFCTQKRFAYGFFVGATAIIALSLIYAGSSGIENFLSMAQNYTYGRSLTPDMSIPIETKYGSGIYVLIFMSIQNPLYAQIVLAIVIACLLVQSVKLSQLVPVDSPELLAFIFSASIALSLQCNRYDLSLLLIPFALILTSEQQSWKRNPWIRYSILGFYLEWLVREVHVGLFVFNLSSFLFITLLFGLYRELLLQAAKKVARQF